MSAFGQRHPGGVRYAACQTPVRCGDHVAYVGGAEALRGATWQIIGFAARPDGRAQIRDLNAPGRVHVVPTGCLSLQASAGAQ